MRGGAPLFLWEGGGGVGGTGCVAAIMRRRVNEEPVTAWLCFAVELTLMQAT